MESKKYNIGKYVVDELVKPIELIVELSSNSRVTLDKKIVELLDLKKGDKISLKIVAVYRQGGDSNGTV